MEIEFQAWDYTREDQFQKTKYRFVGSEKDGWKIERAGLPYLSLGSGYVLLKTHSCGICSTDLDRRFLPFDLPQIIGHELVASDPKNPNQLYVVEINDTFHARGELGDSFCQLGLPTHSPERRVVGIDRLPGGFGPYILAPKNAIFPIDSLDPQVAVLTEPFSASLQAVIASFPGPKEKVAVLGPRRLGSLLLAALSAFKNKHKIDFEIFAIVRHSHLVPLAKSLGANQVIDLNHEDSKDYYDFFDKVYDTTSTSSGFELAQLLTKSELHLKSTNGQEMGGLKHLTELVVDELSLLPYNSKNLKFKWQNTLSSPPKSVYLFPGLDKNKYELDGFKVIQSTLEEARSFLKNLPTNEIPRFGYAIASHPDQIAQAIRPWPGSEESLICPRSAILVDPMGEWAADSIQSREFFLKGKSIRSSRCGDFNQGLEALRDNPDMTSVLKRQFVTSTFKAQNLPQAYLAAREPKNIKVVVEHFD